MSEKQKFTVHRTMMGDKEYHRGDVREMTAADAAPLIETGALSKEGEEPVQRGAPVEHTFGARKSEVDGYTSASGDGVHLKDQRQHAPKPAAAKQPTKKS